MVEFLIECGYMKKDGHLTLKGQRMFIGDPNWLPKPQEKGTATKDNLQKMLLDAGFSTKLEWEDDSSNRETDRGLDSSTLNV